MTGSGSFQVVSGQGYGPKTQLGWGTSVDFAFPLASWLGMETSLDLYGILPSDAQGGFIYRGYGGVALRLSLEAWGTIVSRKGFGDLRVGGGLGAAGCLPSYQYTTLSFFYPEAQAKGFLGFTPAAFPSFDLTLSFPLRVQFRRDMTYSGSLGVGLGVAYVFGRAR